MDSNQNSETIEDIIREIRQDSTPYSAKVADELENQTIGNRVLLEDAATCLRDDELYIKGLADRLEAAWKRDERHALEHATHHAESVASANCRDCIYNPKSENYEGGNAAAMREALMEIRDNAMDDYVQDADYLIEKCNSALAATPRNCDRFSDWWEAHEAWMDLPKDELGYFVKQNGVLLCVLAWLFAPAEKQEGGNDGK